MVGAVEAEREHGLQVRQIVGVRSFAQHKKTIDVGVDQGLGRGVVLEQGQAVFAVFGFDGLAGEFEACPFQQQQRAAEVGVGVTGVAVAAFSPFSPRAVPSTALALPALPGTTTVGVDCGEICIRCSG